MLADRITPRAESVEIEDLGVTSQPDTTFVSLDDWAGSAATLRTQPTTQLAMLDMLRPDATTDVPTSPTEIADQEIADWLNQFGADVAGEADAAPQASDIISRFVGGRIVEPGQPADSFDFGGLPPMDPDLPLDPFMDAVDPLWLGDMDMSGQVETTGFFGGLLSMLNGIEDQIAAIQPEDDSASRFAPDALPISSTTPEDWIL